MSLLSELSKKPEPPVYAATLKQFPPASVAQKLGISCGYTHMILSGNRKPSQALERRLIDLAAQVECELAQ